MKKVIMSVVMLLSVTLSANVTGHTELVDSGQVSREVKKQQELHKEILWDCLIGAIIYVESRGNDHAVGPTNDLGCIQATPIYVAEANRLSGRNYTLSDRTDRKKSIEMFNIIQNHYNSCRSTLKAIYLHNPKAPESYKEKILTQYIINIKNKGYEY